MQVTERVFSQRRSGSEAVRNKKDSLVVMQCGALPLPSDSTGVLSTNTVAFAATRDETLTVALAEDALLLVMTPMCLPRGSMR